MSYGWDGIEEYDPFISLKLKKLGTDCISSNDVTIQFY